MSCPVPATYTARPNGDLCCSHCGSLSEKDFFEITAAFLEGKEGFVFDPSDKDYKIYVNRPGVKNASDGGIKFYTWHADTTNDYERKNDLFVRANKKYREDFKKKYNT